MGGSLAQHPQVGLCVSFYTHHSTWTLLYYHDCLFSYLPNLTESPEDKDLSGSVWVCLGFHCRAWRRGSLQNITGQIYTTAMAEQ